MHEEPHIHVGVTLRAPMPNGGSREITINLSRVSPGMGDQVVGAMLDKAELMADAIITECERRLDPHGCRRPSERARPAPPNPEDCPQTRELARLFASDHAGDANLTCEAEIVEPEPEVIFLDVEDANPGEAPAPAQPHPDESAPIPGASDVRFPVVFGVEVPPPDEAWWDLPLTSGITEQPGQGGQLLALNAGLSALGFKDAARHRAAEAVLASYAMQAFEERTPDRIASLYDLSKADAHLVLTVLGGDPDVSAWRAAIDRGAGHLTIVAVPEVEPAPPCEPPAPEPPSPAPPNPEPRSSSGVDLSDSQARALLACVDAIDAVQTFGDPATFRFITGEAGTGKSTVLRELRQIRSVVVMAPTGLAAINVGGQTIHRTFGFKIGHLGKGHGKPLSGRHRQAIEMADAIVIDEISMVRADVIDAIDWSLRRTFNRLDVPFGGKVIIAFGDLWQLAPIVSDRKTDKAGQSATGSEADWMQAHYASPFWFDAHVFRGAKPGAALIEDVAKPLAIHTHTLTDVFRQAGDPEFIAALNRVRVGDPSGLAIINQRARVQPDWDRRPVVICNTNARCETINGQRLAALGEVPTFFAAESEGDIDENALPAPRNLALAVGAQVMVIKNIMGFDGDLIANGSVGVVESLEGGEIAIRLNDGRLWHSQPETWESVEAEYDDRKKELTERVRGRYTQHPLKLAWAITAHKSQGQTVDSAVIELETQTRTHGQAYVALSRVRSFDGLFLRRELTPADLVVAPAVRAFLQPEAVLAEAFA